MSGSTIDLQSVAQNIAQNINSLSQTWIALNGTGNVAAISTSTLVSTGAGRVVMVSVTTAGSATGTIYDCTDTGALMRPIYIIPMTAGIVEVNFPTNYGIVVVPGTGQVVSVSFS